MLPKIQLLSLKNQKAFDCSAKKSVKFTSRLFVLLATTISNLAVPELLSNKKIHQDKFLAYISFKVSKKYGKANKRNLLKRRIRHIVQLYMQENYSPISLIFIPRFALKTIEYKILKSELTLAISWCKKKLVL